MSMVEGVSLTKEENEILTGSDPVLPWATYFVGIRYRSYYRRNSNREGNPSVSDSLEKTWSHSGISPEKWA